MFNLVSFNVFDLVSLCLVVGSVKYGVVGLLSLQGWLMVCFSMAGYPMLRIVEVLGLSFSQLVVVQKSVNLGSGLVPSVYTPLDGSMPGLKREKEGCMGDYGRRILYSRMSVVQFRFVVRGSLITFKNSYLKTAPPNETFGGS